MKNQHLIKYKNPVILKDEQGKVRQTTYDLPGQKHTYGKKVVDDPQPIKYVVNGWQVASESGEIPSKKKDFKQLNKLATKSGLYTAKQQTDLRNTKDIMVQTKKGQKVIPIMLPQQNFTYGVPNRPSTPMKLVMGNCYALEQDLKNQTMYQNQTNKLAQTQKSKANAKTTKSQQLRQKKASNTKQYLNKPVVEQKFKMSKFVNNPSAKIDTNIKPFLTSQQQNKSGVINNTSSQVQQQK